VSSGDLKQRRCKDPPWTKLYLARVRSQSSLAPFCCSKLGRTVPDRMVGHQIGDNDRHVNSKAVSIEGTFRRLAAFHGGEPVGTSCHDNRPYSCRHGPRRLRGRSCFRDLANRLHDKAARIRAQPAAVPQLRTQRPCEGLLRYDQALLRAARKETLSSREAHHLRAVRIWRPLSVGLTVS
jgi:hypothetical protein